MKIVTPYDKINVTPDIENYVFVDCADLVIKLLHSLSKKNFSSILNYFSLDILYKSSLTDRFITYNQIIPYYEFLLNYEKYPLIQIYSIDTFKDFHTCKYSIEFRSPYTKKNTKLHISSSFVFKENHICCLVEDFDTKQLLYKNILLYKLLNKKIDEKISINQLRLLNIIQPY